MPPKRKKGELTLADVKQKQVNCAENLRRLAKRGLLPNGEKLSDFERNESELMSVFDNVYQFLSSKGCEIKFREEELSKDSEVESDKEARPLGKYIERENTIYLNSNKHVFTCEESFATVVVHEIFHALDFYLLREKNKVENLKNCFEYLSQNDGNRKDFSELFQDVTDDKLSERAEIAMKNYREAYLNQQVSEIEGLAKMKCDYIYHLGKDKNLVISLLEGLLSESLSRDDIVLQLKDGEESDIVEEFNVVIDFVNNEGTFLHNLQKSRAINNVDDPQSTELISKNAKDIAVNCIEQLLSDIRGSVTESDLPEHPSKRVKQEGRIVSSITSATEPEAIVRGLDVQDIANVLEFFNANKQIARLYKQFIDNKTKQRATINQP